MFAARDEGHIPAGLGQAATKVTTNTTCSEDCYAHSCSLTLLEERRSIGPISQPESAQDFATGGTMGFLQEPAFDEKNHPTLKLIKEDYGFIPNFFKAQTARPDLLDAEVQLVEAILIKEGALTRQQKEYIFLVCSAANLSTYCVTAHCEIIRMLKIEGPEPEQIALDHMATDLPIVDKALLNFTLKLNNHPLKVTQEDIDTLKAYGFDDQQILEAVMCVGLAKFANFVGFGLGTVPDYRVRLDLEQSKAVAR